MVEMSGWCDVRGGVPWKPSQVEKAIKDLGLWWIYTSEIGLLLHYVSVNEDKWMEGIKDMTIALWEIVLF